MAPIVLPEIPSSEFLTAKDAKSAKGRSDEKASGGDRKYNHSIIQFSVFIH
jgi:hypothetical protein